MRIPDESPLDNVQGGSLSDKLLNLSDALTTAHDELTKAAYDYAVKDNNMRKAKAKAFLMTEGNNKETREANADAGWAKERLDCNLAEGHKEVCLEHVRSLRAQLSALQALIYARRAENEAIKYGQTQQV